MMTSVTTVHLNPVSAEREEEFNLWYSYVHLRDVMGLPGFCAGEAYVKKTDVLSPALRENLKRLAAEDAAGGN